MQTLPSSTIRIPDDRAKRILFELEVALKQLSAAELATIVLAKGTSDFAASILRRGVNIARLIGSLEEATQREAQNGASAWKAGPEAFSSYVNERVSSGVSSIRNVGEKLVSAIGRIKDDPASELTKICVVAIAALASSGGIDGNGGLPDIDIPLMGIEAHRSPFTHSILIGAGVETVVSVFIRIALLTHSKLPSDHDPVWDQFAKHAPELLEAISKGTSLGLAYHLMVDGLLQPAPYHGLPIEMPLLAHQAILAANGFAEGLDAFHRKLLSPKSPASVRKHRALAQKPFEIEGELIEYLGPEATEILESKGAWMLGLTCGEIQPYTEAQVRFVLCAYQVADPQTAHELAWRRYVNVYRHFFLKKF